MATRAGNIGVQSGTVYLWGVQLEIGSVATPLDYGGTPQQQLAQCQRFFQIVMTGGRASSPSGPMSIASPCPGRKCVPLQRQPSTR